MLTNRGMFGSRRNRKEKNHPVYYALLMFKGILRRAVVLCGP